METTAFGKERRKYRRYERQVPLSLHDRAGEALDENPRLADVGLGGLGFETVAAVRPGHVFRFRLDIPGAGEIRGEAVARWATPSNTGLSFQCGAEFRRLGWAQSRMLRRFLEPPSIGWGQVLDLLLFGAAFFVGRAVVADVQARNPDLLRQIWDRLSDSFEWLPAAAVVAVAVVALGLIFRRKL